MRHEVFDSLALSRIFAFKVRVSSRSCKLALISVIPVRFIKSGTVLRCALSCTRSLGSLAVTSCISTTSGLPTSCFNSATLSRVNLLSFRLDNRGAPFSPVPCCCCCWPTSSSKSSRGGILLETISFGSPPTSLALSVLKAKACSKAAGSLTVSLSPSRTISSTVF
ncbi:hypothetical protein V1477_016512 [Vespula maculifrons]|uniref:Uncharacterized protein n=1 Tax=Vespula maculifrons TaxID=7453 RepID=A0ABD2B9F0_VESMC